MTDDDTLTPKEPAQASDTPDKKPEVRLKNRPGKLFKTYASHQARLPIPYEKVKLSKHVVLPRSTKTARELIADYTKDGDDIVRFMLNAMNGEIKGLNGRARIAAADWLGVYYFGKPVETTVQLSMNANTAALPNLPDDVLEDFARQWLPSKVQVVDADAVTVDPDPDGTDGD